MNKMPLPSQEVLRQLLEYDPETGALTWKERGPEWFAAGKHSPKHRCKIWNTRYAGKPAITAQDGKGYLCGSILDRCVQAHRVIWKLVYGDEPDEIDHINGVRGENRIANLRAASRITNMRNKARSVTNTSGVTGVYWNRKACKWCAQIHSGGRAFFLGAFDDLNDAAAARKAGERKFDFHPNHGRAA